MEAAAGVVAGAAKKIELNFSFGNEWKVLYTIWYKVYSKCDLALFVVIIPNI
ncbi:hypothetical protein [Botryobacter ruber]|uniref:hypothetical protein n=1 Tax=Botryobacter ruber TaxID=2171629 RepID=UPI0013E40DCF|nr:hypothetical protein [Botryobacter ruber]